MGESKSKMTLTATIRRGELLTLKDITDLMKNWLAALNATERSVTNLRRAKANWYVTNLELSADKFSISIDGNPDAANS